MSNKNSLSAYYRNPLGTRYASLAMSRLFSDEYRAETWRTLWVYLAEEQKRLGLPITKTQIDSMKKAVKKTNFKKVREFEVQLKHDVMSHIKAFALDAPKAEPIIHLGATSCFVTDNADALILREATQMLIAKSLTCIEILSDQIEKHKSLICSGFTHFQPAQPSTIGKRLCLWAQDLMWDVEELVNCLSRLQPLGCKGATGTQASFSILFDGNFKKVKDLDRAICRRMGFQNPVAVSGQTLSRKLDIFFVQALAGLAASFSKISYDLRLLQALGQVREPFGKSQVGSSAMAYKRNPILAERITGLSRFLMSLSINPLWTHSTQWLERSLDDSSNRRLVLPEAFLVADAICELGIRILKDLDVDEEKIQKHLDEHLEVFETEAEMMKATLRGDSRQRMHEVIRKQTVFKKRRTAAKNLEAFAGFAEEQAEDFLRTSLKPFLFQMKKKDFFKSSYKSQAKKSEEVLI